MVWRIEGPRSIAVGGTYNSTMIPRFFCPTPLRPGVISVLPEAISNHVVRVLRLKVYDRLTLFDGTGGEYLAQLVSAGRKAEVEVIAFDPVERESPIVVHLAQSLAVADKMDWVVQKAVELGVSAIVPVASERSVLKLAGERAAKRVAHWQAVAVAACEQCGRNRIPRVDEVQDLRQLLAAGPELGARYILAPGAESRPGNLPRPVGVVTVLVGPEGGFSPAELGAAAAQGWHPLGMGPRILRTETAGLAVLSALNTRFGDA